MTTAAITPGYASHPDADLLAQLAEQLSPLGFVTSVSFGVQADSENTTGGRVVFMEKGWQGEPIARQPSDGMASFDGWRLYDVALYAPNMGALYRLWQATIDKLDYLLSWTGFEHGKTTAPKGGDDSGFGLTMPVTIKGPVYREVYGSETVETVTISAQLTEADGSGAEAIEPDPIVVEAA